MSTTDEKLQEVITLLGDLRTSVDAIDNRVSNIENVRPELPVGDNTRNNENQAPNDEGVVQAQAGANHGNDGNNGGSDVVQPTPNHMDEHQCANDEHIQELFRIIQDSVTRSRLPPDLKLHDSGGVKRRSQPMYNIIRKCARYTETVLKLVSHIQIEPANHTSSRALQDIHTCLVAEIKFLQEEYTGIIVQGSFGEEAGDIYHNLQKNTSVFTEDRLPLVKTAVELAHIRQQQPVRGAQGQGFYGGRGQSRGRGQRYHSYNPGNSFNNRGRGQDVYSNMASRSINNAPNAKE